jgi:ABC-type uncharacterized transport system auxiliary subunit
MSRLARAGALLLALGASGAIPLGCLSKSYPEKQRYVFEVEPVADVALGVDGVLRVDRVRVSPLFERKGFVYRTGDATFENDFYNEFFAPPAVLLRKATLNRLRGASIFSSVLDATQRAEADWILEGQVKELYGDLRDRTAPAAMLQIEYTLLDARSPGLDVAFRKTYSARDAARSASAAAIMTAWNDGLARILTDLEVDLRRETSR